MFSSFVSYSPGELEYRKAAFARLQELKIRMDRTIKRASHADRELAVMKYVSMNICNEVF
jgi:hypothetical protein